MVPSKVWTISEIKGIGSERLAKIKKYLTHGKSTDAKKPPPAPTAAAHTPAKADSRRAALPP